MGDNEEKTQQARLTYEVAVYKEQLRLLEREIERINITTIDLTNAQKTIGNLKMEDVLVPVGGGAFIKANVYTTKSIVPIGADYLVEIEKDNAGDEIKRRIEATKKAIEKLNEEFEKIAIKLQESGVKLREIRAREAFAKREELSEAYL